MASSSDSFWGWIKDATAIAGELLFLLLVAAKEGGGRPVKRTLFRRGEPGQECSFTYDSGQVYLVNSTSDTVCTATFSVNGELGVSIDYVAVQPNSRENVSDLLLKYSSGGSVGLNAIPASAAGGPGVDDAVSFLLRSVAIGTLITMTAVGVSLLIDHSQVIWRNTSPNPLAASVTLSTPGFSLQFQLGATVPAGQTVSVPYPDQSQVPQNEFDTVSGNVSAPAASPPNR
jgi:hypothetical protein